MSHLPTYLNVIPNCPDCAVPVGNEHVIDCLRAICLSTGRQRILCHADPPPTDLPGVDLHICGDDEWTGLLHGVHEAVKYGLFVRPGTPDDPSQGWIPCQQSDPGAVPDLDRLMRSGEWNPIRQRWEMPEPEVGRG